MTLLGGLGIGVAFLAAIFSAATHYGRALEIALAILLTILGFAYPIAVFLLEGSLVDPLAALWGDHSVLKVSIAGALYALYPLAILALGKASGSRWLWRALMQGAADRGRQGKCPAGRPVLNPAWLPAAYFIAQSVHLMITFVQYPHALGGEQLAAMSARPGYSWLLRHPTLAIHHTYAGATFLWTLILGTLLALYALPIAKAVVTASKRPKLMEYASIVLAIAGLLLAFLTAR